MGARIPRHGDYTLPEHADIPQWEIDRERGRARAELRACLTRRGADRERADRLACRVVPDRSTYTRLEREHRAHADFAYTPARVIEADDGLGL